MRKKSFFNKVILGKTKTRQLSGASIKVAKSKYLSQNLYDAIDNNIEESFDIKDESGKVYTVRQLIPSTKK